MLNLGPEAWPVPRCPPELLAPGACHEGHGCLCLLSAVLLRSGALRITVSLKEGQQPRDKNSSSPPSKHTQLLSARTTLFRPGSSGLAGGEALPIALAAAAELSAGS